MPSVNVENVINRLAAKVGELSAQVALLEVALEEATGDAVVEE